jgi:hypothetical protein
MVGLELLLIAGLLTFKGTSAMNCAPSDVAVGVCGAISGSSASLTATEKGSGAASDAARRSNTHRRVPASPDPRALEVGACVAVRGAFFGVQCRTSAPTNTIVPAAPPPGAPAVTLTDIASFRPTPGTDHMQPDGWTVAGLDTNFFAQAPQQVVPGTLLGRPAEVRFTAVGFHWDYGDGTRAARGTPGGTWEQLGTAEFDPTPTSHVYVTRGDYTIRLQVDYAAEYRFDGPDFVAIPGTITLPANDLRITVGDAKTVLVDRSCAADPSGPGC